MRAVKVARKKGPDGKQLPVGFGFVECSSEAAAKSAVKALQGSTLDGHKLVLQLSLKKPAAGGADDGSTAAGGKRKAAGGKAGKASGLPDTSKMVVRNVAFEATRKDIQGLFTPFGQVKSCRLPRKFDGTHRCACVWGLEREMGGCMGGWAGAGLVQGGGAARVHPVPPAMLAAVWPDPFCCPAHVPLTNPPVSSLDIFHPCSGFAFVDFATKQEARNAMEAVQGAHLYGRRLVLEWAAEEGGLDELRAKTGGYLRGMGAD